MLNILQTGFSVTKQQEQVDNPQSMSFDFQPQRLLNHFTWKDMMINAEV